MKPVEFSRHARQQMTERGASEAEVVETLRSGQLAPAKHGRLSYRKNFQYEAHWGGKYYAVKQILVVVVDETDSFVVVTVYSFYF